MKRRLPRSFWILGHASIALAAAASCRSVEGTRGVPPLVEIYDTPSSLEARRGEAGSELFVRPFFGLERRGDPVVRRLKILLPFIDFEWGAESGRYRVLPVFEHRYRRKRTGGIDSDTMLFPLLFWGSDPEEGGYFAFFPFGGKTRGLVGQEEIVFVLFPLYAQLRTAGRRSTHILWPLVNSVSGGGWSGGRLFPFYGHYTWETEAGTPRAERRFILWPFCITGRQHQQQDPTEVFLSVPFYGRRENSASLTRAYLWPLCVTHYDKKEKKWLVGGYLIPYRFSGEQFDPWPFFGAKLQEEDRWASVGRRRERFFFVWPLVRYDHGDDLSEETLRVWALPVFFFFSSVDKRTLECRTHWQVWPLCEHKTRNHETAFNLLAPLWFDWASYERLYGRLFALFRYRSRVDFSAWELLYGTLYWQSSPEESVFSVLGGLLEVGARKGSLRMRLLYVPWWA
ncbi:MAG: hypothetical protein JXA90_01775 [Planctomycetes bacterium]|nr:hypothetical protein [Planctomycetota bacterium]